MNLYRRLLRSPRTILAVALLTLPTIGCNWSFESPGSGNIFANVPWYLQENPYYCGAAVVQMLAAWSGSTYTQQQLFIAMNGTPGYGITVNDLAQGIRNFTALYDAQIDTAPYTDNSYFARQIASVSNQYPVACTTDANTHSVVLYGGAWHTVIDSNNHRTYYWDNVYFHDPGRGGGLNYTAGAWQSLHCQTYGSYCVQIISQSAAAEGPKTLADYNPTVYVGGGDDGGPRGPYDY